MGNEESVTRRISLHQPLYAFDRKLNVPYILRAGIVSPLCGKHISLLPKVTRTGLRGSTPRSQHSMGEIIIPSIKRSVFDAFALSLERERRRTCRLSRNEINARGVGPGAPAQSFRRAAPHRHSSTGPKRRETPRRHVDTVKGKSGREAQRRQKGSFVFVCEL